MRAYSIIYRLYLKEPWLRRAVQEVQWLRDSWPATNNCFSHMSTTALQYTCLTTDIVHFCDKGVILSSFHPPRLLSRGCIMEGQKFWLSEVTFKLGGERGQQRRQLHHLDRAPQPPQQSPL